jgi:RNA polymerase sigma-70 factor (ECF subfamily)
MNERWQRAEELDDAELVAAVIGGDRPAFEALYARHHAALFRTAMAITRDQGAAEELLQEAFLRAYRHLDRVRLVPGASLRPWLHRILINLTYDWAARQRRVAGLLDDPVERLAAPGLSLDRHAERGELQRVVADALECLPFQQRIVIVLFYLLEMDLQEIATTLNVPPGTVKSRLFYGRARLRQALLADRRLPAATEWGYVSTSA